MSAQHALGPHPERFSYIAWQMAPRVMPAEIHPDPKGGATRIVYMCGHSGEHASHFMHTLTDKQGYRCGQCGKAKASKLPEFAGWYDEAGAAIAKATGEQT